LIFPTKGNVSVTLCVAALLHITTNITAAQTQVQVQHGNRKRSSLETA